MSKEKRRVPKLRFPGFTEDWEQRKFSDITYLSGIKNKENKPYESYSISNEFGFIPQDEQFENGGTMKTADKSMYYIVSQNSFAYNPARINVGSIGYYDKPNNVIVSSLYEVFKTIDIVNDKFLWHWFKSNQFNRLIEKYQDGGVRLYFYYDKLCKGTIDLPTINEQNKISNLLDRLDLYITLHQRKLNNLKLKKKALLQKLFPKNGERYPELRFPGFTDAWEQRKFGELFILKSGVAFKLSEYTKTGIPIINGESIKAGKISLEKINYLPNEYQYKYQECLLFPGDIVLGLNRPIIDGTLKISRIPADIKKSLLYQRAGKIIFKVNMDENFTYQLLSKEVLTFTKKEAVGSDQPFITTTKLNKWDLYFPVKDKERRNIGSLFNNIDNIITLHQRKLDHLQLQKKALLQQMFV